MVIHTTIDIDAPPERVWAALSDFAAYPDWNPLTVKVEGELVVDAVVKLHVDLGGDLLVRKHVISRVDPHQALCWIVRTRKPWLMRGERCQRIEDLGDGRSRFTNEEGVFGLTSYIVALTHKGRIRAGLEAMSQALKERAEAG